MTYTIEQQIPGYQWEPIPNGEFPTFDEALDAMATLERELGWSGLRVAGDGLIEYGWPRAC